MPSRIFLSAILILTLAFTASAQELVLREAFGEPEIYQVEFSPNGTYLYATDAYSNVFRVERATGVLELLPKEHTSTVRAMAFFGNDLVTVDMSQQLCHWVGDKRLLRRRKNLATDIVTGFPHMAINQRSGEVILGGSDIMMIADLDPGEQPQIYPSELGFVSALACSPSGQYLAASFGDKVTQLISTADLEVRKRGFHQHTHGYALAFSPDSEWFYYTDGRQLGMQALHTEEHRYSQASFPSTISALEMSADGRLAVGTVNGVISLMDPQADTLHLQLQTGRAKINDLSFSPDGRLIAAATDSGIYWIDAGAGEWRAFTTTVDHSRGYVHFAPDDYYQANAAATGYLSYHDESSGSYSALPASDPNRIDDLLPRLLAGEEIEPAESPCLEMLAAARQSFDTESYARALDHLDALELCDREGRFLEQRRQMRQDLFAALQQQAGHTKPAPGNTSTVDVLNRQGKDLALFFAIDNYDAWPALDNPISDAEALAGDLSEHYGFVTEIVRNPSKREIYDKLEEYRQRTYGEDAQLLIFFSGHGEYNESTAEGFLIPREGVLGDRYQESYIPHSRLAPRVNNIPCPHILLAIDACYSGTFDQEVAKYRGLPGQAPGGADVSERSTFVYRLLQDQSRLYVTSGGKERTPDGDEYSPFTEHWLQALRSYGGDDGILTYRELMSIVEGAEPQPRSGPFGGHEIGGSFLFLAQ